MSVESPVRCEVIFRGHVQGVGFRFTVADVANNYPISGYVINLRDGTVRLIAEGLRKDVSQLIRGVQGAMSGYITGSSESWGAATGEFPAFEVRYEGR